MFGRKIEKLDSREFVPRIIRFLSILPRCDLQDWMGPDIDLIVKSELSENNEFGQTKGLYFPEIREI